MELEISLVIEIWTLDIPNTRIYFRQHTRLPHHMVPQIDFLPATYHVQRQREHKTLWRRMFVFFFLVLAVLGTWQQRDLRRKLEARRDLLQSKAEGLLQPVKEQSRLEERLQELETRALLLTTLELRVPMTRVLAAITSSLPEMVSLNDCQAETALKETSPLRSGQMPPLPVANKDKKPSPIEADLAELRNAARLSATMLTLSGIAPDDLTISQYLVALRETGLFERVTLSFTGQHLVREENWRKFEVRLQVKNSETLLDHSPAAAHRITKETRSRETSGASR